MIVSSASSSIFPPGTAAKRALVKSYSREEDWFWGLGESTAKIRADIELAGRYNVHVVVIGETGTGKEIIAQELHRLRRERLGLCESECPFVPVNSGAVPEALAESILFGHERGAFTSARERQYGKFEIAKRGTLFLDEIQSLSLSTQIKLLRVLQSGDLDRLGGRSQTKIDCQVVAATNIPLELLVDRNMFRKDLYYRLNICPIYLPALRNRLEDLPVLAKGLLDRLQARHRLRSAEISPEAFELLLSHSWPGNIRELEHVLLYAAFRAAGAEIHPQHLPPSLTGELDNYLQKGTWNF